MVGRALHSQPSFSLCFRKVIAPVPFAIHAFQDQFDSGFSSGFFAGID
jgi:hypothetical protein